MTTPTNIDRPTDTPTPDAPHTVWLTTPADANGGPRTRTLPGAESWTVNNDGLLQVVNAEGYIIGWWAPGHWASLEVSYDTPPTDTPTQH